MRSCLTGKEGDSLLEAVERIAEIGSILALGLHRLCERKSSTLLPEIGESSLHFSPTKNGHEPRFSGMGMGHDGGCVGKAGEAQDCADVGVEAAVARTLRQRGAAL